MTKKEAIEILKEDGCGNCTWQSTNPYECENKECEVKEAHNMAISALEHTWRGKAVKMMYCEDAISREEVLEQAWTLEYPDSSSEEVVNVKDIEQLPPVKPSRRKGHWIPVYQGDEIINYHCSECGIGDTNGSTNLYVWGYCRRCGAEMVEPQESEDKE